METNEDAILQKISSHDDIVGDFVRFFLSSSDDTSAQWVDEWFVSRTKHYLSNLDADIRVPEDYSALSFEVSPAVPRNVRLLSLQPNYFRGFKTLQNPINLRGDLVVLAGRNSSGKTSLAEAMEWLLTGSICRRELGDAKELADCVGNQIKPDEEEVWVEGIFLVDEETISIRRILVQDYGGRRNSACESVLFKDREQLSIEQEQALLEELFANIPPLLMQHTLRQFVLNPPDKRREYFERLLSLAGITHLIERAVVGDAGLGNFPSPTGSTMLGEWESLKRSVQSDVHLHNAERAQPAETKTTVISALTQIAVQDMGIESPQSFDGLVDTIVQIQKATRQQRFPLLDVLRPERTLDEATIHQLSEEFWARTREAIDEKRANYQQVIETLSSIDQAQNAIAKAFQVLEEAGLVDEQSSPQVCPLCGYEDIPTLTHHRIEEIRSWLPLEDALSKAKRDYFESLQELQSSAKSIKGVRFELIPPIPDESQWLAVEDLFDMPEVQQIREELNHTNELLESIDRSCDQIISAEVVDETVEAMLTENFSRLVSGLANLVDRARSYASCFKELESQIGLLSSQDEVYVLRELWHVIATRLDILVSDLHWEIAKRNAQDELKRIRDVLIRLRQGFLENRRSDFSDGISHIWKLLREDRYSSFDRLFIPKPSGKGFPVRIEVKAVLDDGSRQQEVDALSVFSESQINVVGLAAFITRSHFLGHKLLILDDPVQSMDEEHFRTFAQKVLPFLREQGFQIIVLTHNDTFERQISYAHIDHDNYVTMEIRHSRRNGCQVDEGSRRVAERLKRAEKFAEDGELDRAWYYVRIALERLYTVVQIKHGPEDFDPSKWENHTAENMWEESVGSLIENLIPGNGERLHEILQMTVSGAHDKTSTSNIDLFEAINDIRDLLNPLKIGAG